MPTFFLSLLVVITCAPLYCLCDSTSRDSFLKNHQSRLKSITPRNKKLHSYPRIGGPAVCVIGSHLVFDKSSTIRSIALSKSEDGMLLDKRGFARCKPNHVSNAPPTRNYCIHPDRNQPFQLGHFTYLRNVSTDVTSLALQHLDRVGHATASSAGGGHEHACISTCCSFVMSETRSRSKSRLDFPKRDSTVRFGQLRNCDTLEPCK